MHDCLHSGGHFFLLTPSVRSFTCQHCHTRPSTPPYRCLLEVCAHTVCEPCATLLHRELWNAKLQSDANPKYDIEKAVAEIIASGSTGKTGAGASTKVRAVGTRESLPREAKNDGGVRKLREAVEKRRGEMEMEGKEKVQGEEEVIEADDGGEEGEEVEIEYRSARLAAARGRERRRMMMGGAGYAPARTGGGANLAGVRAVRS